MVLKKIILGSVVALLIGGLSQSASAEEARLYHGQSGVMLVFADGMTTILYNALLAKEFDPEIVKTLPKDLERMINDAKRAIDRTRIILGDEKLEPEFTKLLDVVKRAESQLGRLSTDIEEQT